MRNKTTPGEIVHAAIDVIREATATQPVEPDRLILPPGVKWPT